MKYLAEIKVNYYKCYSILHNVICKLIIRVELWLIHSWNIIPNHKQWHQFIFHLEYIVLDRSNWKLSIVLKYNRYSTYLYQKENISWPICFNSYNINEKINGILAPVQAIQNQIKPRIFFLGESWSMHWSI